MLMPNCLFRVGGAAMLLSNRRRDGLRAKYELKHVVRTHLGANDEAYGCIFQVRACACEFGCTQMLTRVFNMCMCMYMCPLSLCFGAQACIHPSTVLRAHVHIHA